MRIHFCLYDLQTVLFSTLVLDWNQVDLHKDDANGGRGVVAPSDLVCHYFWEGSCCAVINIYIYIYICQ